MTEGNIQILEPDARLSRLMCRVAQRMGIHCVVVKDGNELETACNHCQPDAILIDPSDINVHGEKIIQYLADRHITSPIVLVNTNVDEVSRLYRLGTSLGLKMGNVLPEGFDSETLKKEFSRFIKSA